MVCRHRPGDPSCSSSPNYQPPYEPSLVSVTPDKAKYQIEEVERVGLHLVIKALYPNCKNCSYEGRKVMVFLGVTEAQVLKWREIDPHFRDPKKPRSATEAPSPAARFPASPEGWQDAIAYARSKAR